MFIVESMHGITLDSDRSMKDVIARHHTRSQNHARVFYVANGIKKFMTQI